MSVNYGCRLLVHFRVSSQRQTTLFNFNDSSRKFSILTNDFVTRTSLRVGQVSMCARRSNVNQPRPTPSIKEDDRGKSVDSQLKLTKRSPQAKDLSRTGFVTTEFPGVADKIITRRLPKELVPYAKLMRLDKPTGVLLLVWPSYWSIALATPSGMTPSLEAFALFGMGAVLMRGAGCTINDMWDKDYDAKVKRTMHRPLASGQISRKEATFFLAGQLGLSALIVSTFDINSIILGASSLLLVSTYPLSKRFTHWSQLVLGLTFNWGALLGWSVVSGGTIYLPAVLPLYVSGVFWTLIYDTIYAHQDKTDDLMIGLKSTAIKFGDRTKTWLSLFSVGMVSSLVAAGAATNQVWPYHLSIMLVAGHLSRQIITLDINNAENCWQRFRENSQIGWILFVGIVISTFLKVKSDNSVQKPAEVLQSVQIGQ